ncbi:cyclophilin-like fold protein [uncultured Helicobacter sp.]|uniref:cyclophilin-like fold protein n=1 Tax=uncultured Helicobacter sp. TaxID=175537 RepID=UPI00259013FA|nr:cyclophilin-like fold protein [uncultured Helicobacter sp.]
MQKFCLIALSFLSLMGFVKGENMQIIMNVKGAEFVLELEDNIATRDFLTLLPLSLEFSDYVGKEKIAPKLPKKLNTAGLNGYTPSVGDFFYFSPWGNLGIFYEKQPFHNGLVKLGKLDSKALAIIKAQDSNFVIEFKQIN